MKSSFVNPPKKVTKTKKKEQKKADPVEKKTLIASYSRAQNDNLK
jgi:hypothetical protein